MKRLVVVVAAVLVVACTVNRPAVHAMSCVEDRVEWVYLKQRETYSRWRDLRPQEPFYNVVESSVRLTSIDAPAGPWTPWTPKTLAGGRYRYAEYSRTVQVDVVCPSTTTSSTTTTPEVPPSTSTTIPTPPVTTTSAPATTAAPSTTVATVPPAGGSSTTSTPPVSSSPSTTTAPPTGTSPTTTLRLCDGSAGPCELPATGLAAGTVIGLALALFIAGLGALAAACKGRSS